MSLSISPNHREVLSAVSTITGSPEYLKSTSGALTITGTVLVDTSLLATSAKQDTGNASLASIDTKTPTVGQKTMAASSPVVIASDQSTLPFQGAKTNNNAAPGATNVGVLPAVATAAAPSLTEGNQAAISQDLSGNARQTLGTIIMSALDSIVSSDGVQPNNTILTPYSVRITSNTTTTPVSATAYISCITVCVETAGTTSTVDIRDKQGTPFYLVRSLATTAVPAGGNFIFNFQKPMKMLSGIDIITAGGAAATISVFIDYY